MDRQRDRTSAMGGRARVLVLSPEILTAAPESPWILPRQVFERRADTQIAAPTGATHSAARTALAEPGSVLDVGAAAGATSLPPVGRAAGLGLPATVLCGRWPELADETPVADVVVCGNVVYNVADLAPFVHALTGHARRRVIVEVAAAHALTELNPLWRGFHGIDQ